MDSIGLVQAATVVMLASIALMVILTIGLKGLRFVRTIWYKSTFAA